MKTCSVPTLQPIQEQGQLLSVPSKLIGWFQSQLTQPLCWAPLCFAIGIAAFFGVRTEPSWFVLGQVFGVAVGICGLAVWAGRLRPLIVLISLIPFGFSVAGLRTHLVSAPVLEYRFYGPVTGQVVHVDQSFSGKPRVILRVIAMGNLARTPKFTRIALHDRHQTQTPDVGQVIAIAAHLSPPPGPVEPHAFDFQKTAWFKQLGAVGYSRSPFVIWDTPPATTLTQIIARARFRIANYFITNLSPDTGPVVAAITVGLRGDIPVSVTDALRAANLSHLLAISGLHMGLLMTLIFTLIRWGLTCSMHSALFWPTKKIAALCAVAAGVIYLFFSGGSVATQRAFVMAAVMFMAIVFDRRAISIRTLALAAMLILVLWPETLQTAGFQMSFAATTALIVTFDFCNTQSLLPQNKVIRWGLASILSAAVAGTATMPFAAAHFNQIPHYGVLANFIAVPVMGMVVMPGVLVTLTLYPVGLDWIGLAIVEFGITLILQTADFVATLPRSTTAVIAPAPMVLPMIAVGAMVCVILRGYIRLIGVACVMAGCVVWQVSVRPDILISPNGRQIGIIQTAKRVIIFPNRARFATSVWQRRDGMSQIETRLVTPSDGISTEFYDICDIHSDQTPCVTLHGDALKGQGAIAGYRDGPDIIWITHKSVVGDRIWNSNQIRSKYLIGAD